MNSWDDQKVRDALAKNGQKKVVVSGLWTEVCNNTFAFSAMSEGDYQIYMVADASGGTSKEAHDYSMQRMIQAGVVPVTRSEEHTSELQSLMRISYAVFCLKKKKQRTSDDYNTNDSRHKIRLQT